MIQNLKYKFTISNFFIFLSAIFLIIEQYNQNIFMFGLNTFFYENGLYLYVIIQFILYNFLHGGIFHFLMNSVFIYIFGNQVEEFLGKKTYIIFFIFTSFFIGISFLFFSKPISIFGISLPQTSGNIIGISGFALALLSYYTLLLWEKNIEEYKSGIVAIILNISLGLMGNISFAGHFFGALAGIIFYFILKIINKKKSHNFLTY